MKSKLLVTSMSTIAGLYGVLIIFLMIVFHFLGIGLNYLLLGSVIFLIIQFLIAPFFTDLVMKFLYKADFKATMPEYLVNFINEVCKENKMKYPKIGYINDGAPNAFTYGRTKNDARVVLTRGVFELLTPEEVKTVVAHELGHAVHYDMFFMTVAQIVPLILRWIYEVTVNSNNNGDGKSKYTAIIGIVAFVLHVITQYVILWFSRTREFFADEFAVLTTKDPYSMSSALVKIGYGLVTKNVEDNKEKKKTADVSLVSALGIFDAKTAKSLVVSSYNSGKLDINNVKKAARWELWNPWATWYEINSTHPRISKRLNAISKYSAQFNQSPYVVFDETKPESYVDDFAIELLIQFCPGIIFLTTAILFGISMINDTPNFRVVGVGLLFLAIAYYIKLGKSYKNSGYTETTVSNLLGEVKVSNVTSIPCVLKGTFIGRGTPGYIFSEDFVLRDETGIIFIDYKQPISIMNFFFGLFKAKKYINKEVEIKGWYKRSPVPYVELYKMTVDGKKKTCYTYPFMKIFPFLLIICGIVFTILG